MDELIRKETFQRRNGYERRLFKGGTGMRGDHSKEERVMKEAFYQRNG